MIAKETIDKIFEVARIEEIIKDFIPIKKKGVNYIGNCPFHNEKTPSFTVSPSKGIYKCFGCGKGGNAIKFIMEIEHYTYPDALKFIAKKYQIEIIEKELSKEEQVKENKKESLYIISKFANKLFQKNLWETEEGKTIALSYFKERSFNEEIIKKFELGYNLKKKNQLSKNAIKSGFDKSLLVDSGLSLLNNHTGEYIDRFKERAIFPIHSFSGRVLGFGGRSFNNNAKAKYLNSPESLIYYKSKVVYGLYQSKSIIAKENNCFIVEGYTDVITMHQNGIKNVVSASGTALALDQLKLIARITDNITLLFDGDQAGIKATYRTINLALKQGMSVNAVIFPENEDPDSYCRKFSNQEFKSYLETNTLNFVDYKIRISKLKTVTDPREIIKIKRDIFNSISMIPDSLARTQYCKTYHIKLDINEKTMLEEVSKYRSLVNIENKPKKLTSAKLKEKITPKSNKELKINQKLYNTEKEILRILLNYGNKTILSEEENITVFKMIINDLLLDNITFSTLLFNNLYTEITKNIKTHGKINIENFINHPNEDISGLAIDLISREHTISENWKEKHNIFTAKEDEKMKQTTEKSILSLKKCHVDIEINILQKKIKQGNVNIEDMKKLNTLTKIKTDIAKILGRNVG